MFSTNEYSAWFDPSVRERGEEYFSGGRVVRARIDQAGRLSATVRGSDSYRVSIGTAAPVSASIGGGGRGLAGQPVYEPDWSCTCPYFDGGAGPCKHIWATLLEAERNGLLDELRAGRAQAADEGNGASGSTEAGPGVSAAADAGEASRLANAAPLAPAHRSETKPRARSTAAPARKPDLPRAKPPTWHRTLERVREEMGQFEFWAGRSGAARRTRWQEGRRLIYVIDLAETTNSELGHVMVEVCVQMAARDGSWGSPRLLRIAERDWLAAPDPEDSLIAQMVLGTPDGWDNEAYEIDAVFAIPGTMYDTLLRRMCQTGRCFFRENDAAQELMSLAWDDGPAWTFALRLDDEYSGDAVRLSGYLRRENEEMPLSAASILLYSGAVITGGKVSRLDHHDAWPLIQSLRHGEPVIAFKAQVRELLGALFKLPHLPPLDIPPELGIEAVSGPPCPVLRIARPGGSNANARPGAGRTGREARTLEAKLSFSYSGHVVEHGMTQASVLLPDQQKLIIRDLRAEEAAVQRLLSLEFRDERSFHRDAPLLRVRPNKLATAVLTLAAEGWRVEADGKLYRRAGSFKVNVNSGIDWFELNASVEFDGQVVALPRLLAALRKGEGVVRLDDGTLGILPEEWLKKYAPLAELGTTGGGDNEQLRFTPAQVGFLDALLSEMPDVNVDEVFVRAREQLRRFEGIAPADPARSFVGTLRPYQRDGLGWLQFLREFRFGGCLADDMGLGKTVQVLAMLDARRAEHPLGVDQRPGPSLVVVPRSLVFNWFQEAKRFTPQLRVLDHTGIARRRDTGHFADFDLVITTYGTLRRDASYFREFEFDYVILDESQAVKNAGTESSKAVRLLRGRHRLAMSGTPIENHLGELWTLFDFLNPGLMRGSNTLRTLGGGSAGPAREARSVLSRALRPFILRRTKAQVATDLPDKVEQTIYCELEDEQRKLYDELRDHYRKSLLDRIAEVGLNKAKIQILEALLRLRQAACHPGLIEKKRVKDPSAKLDTLLEQLDEVTDEGHKVLVFSQFTSMLAIVRDRLDAKRVRYEYLDGQTRDRQARVEKFQSDPDCKLFLISLKAGGLGLNLTAADYVYLLDPWWNPAVEAQAIDRAHRIGQHRSVFAYRLIAKNTVEEKVVELQQSKRELADAIINADNSVISSLNREDLDLLLS